jgi:hypothetical protein
MEVSTLKQQGITHILNMVRSDCPTLRALILFRRKEFRNARLPNPTTFRWGAGVQ